MRINMESDPEDYSTRVVDMITPIGFGQRGLIVSPPRAGKTILMQRMARSLLKNYPDAYVMMLLIDERPEEVTDMEREVKGRKLRGVSSTFDEPSARHVHVAHMVLKKRSVSWNSAPMSLSFSIPSRDWPERSIKNVHNLAKYSPAV